MRVAYVSADPGVPVFGQKGSSVHVQSVVGAFLRRGADVDLFTCRLGGHPPPGLERVRLHELPYASARNAAARERILLAANAALGAALARAEPPDLVYERCSLWSVAALEHARRSEVPAVLEVNAPLVDEQAAHRTLVDRCAAERIADRQATAATVLAAVSAGVADHLRRRHPGAAGRVEIVPNGIDPDRFPAPAPADPGRPFTVGFVGTLKPWHGIPTLVDAFARVRELVPGARLLVVGHGPERAALEADLDVRGLRGAVELAGAVAPADVPGLLARMDVSVAPYPALEPFYFSPLKVVESMAAGVPVVASAVGDLPRLIDDGHTGLLVPAGDAEALGDALTRLARTPARRQALGAAARERALQAHTWDAVVDRILELTDAARSASVAA